MIDTVTLETAQALRDAGVEMETYFRWQRRRTASVGSKSIEDVYPETTWHEWCKWEIRPCGLYMSDSNKIIISEIESIPAPTLSELLRELPHAIEVDSDTYKLLIDYSDCSIGFVDCNNAAECGGYFGGKQSLEDAAAKLLRRCKENGHYPNLK